MVLGIIGVAVACVVVLAIMFKFRALLPVVFLRLVVNYAQVLASANSAYSVCV